MIVTRDEFEKLRKIVKELIEANKSQMAIIESQQKQIKMLNQRMDLITKLV
jgi:hypothetical protein